VEHYIKQTRRQTINHIVFGHHVAVTIAPETRRDFQKEARILRPDGTSAFVEPFPEGAPAREASCKALDDQIRAQCAKFCTLQQTKHEGRKQRKLKDKAGRHKSSGGGGGGGAAAAVAATNPSHGEPQLTVTMVAALLAADREMHRGRASGHVPAAMEAVAEVAGTAAAGPVGSHRCRSAGTVIPSRASRRRHTNDRPIT
jgi:hypothetical protein